MSDATHLDIAVVVLGMLRAKRLTTTEALAFLGDTTTIESLVSADARVDDVANRIGIQKGELNATFSEARATLQKGIDAGVQPIHYGHPAYPKNLRSIVDAPPILHVRGNMAAFDGLPGVAIVGTRRATAHGLVIAERIASFIGAAGYPVVSGLALGIDAAAHEGALKANAPTIAVLAHGLKAASPKANAHLAARILEQGGAWVSEHTIDVPARPEYFVHRNRIQVGLSCASIIVEGQEKSGSMTQAEFCLRNKRTLFAVLPEFDSAVSTQHELPRMLVRQRGATAIRSRADYPALLDVVARRASEMRTTA
jgi:DNA processing protein